MNELGGLAGSVVDRNLIDVLIDFRKIVNKNWARKILLDFTIP